MMGPTHMLVGAGLGLGASAALGLDPLHAAGLVGAATMTSRLPDIVQRGGPTAKRSRHRKASHSVVATAFWTLLATAACLAVSPSTLVLAGGVLLGYGGHVAADGCTPKGVVPWWPVNSKRVWLLPRGLRIKTNGPVEHVFAFVLCIGLLAGVALRYAGT